MGVSFSPEQLEAFFHQHAAAEQLLDVDATMDTVSPDVEFDVFPLDMRFTGVGAVRVFYERLLGPYLATIAEHGVRSISYGPTFILAERTYRFATDGTSPVIGYAATQAGFDSTGRVVSERFYLSSECARRFRDVLGPEILRVPGVTRVPGTEASLQ